MRIFAILLLVTLCLCPIGQAQPLPKAGHQSGESSQKAQNLVARGYKPITWIENKKFIGSLVGVGFILTLGLGLLGINLTEHQACKAVEKQQRILQERWDEMHPDGFTPAGDQMRPISFDCKTQERHLKPLVSYNNPAELYR
ncbi:uncharacterized protein UHOD_11006 [Ustilago sp. UG-2017b]|nr:uncharacterized protein UHOD_11006 [Ustilago sp. UG-2017b]